MVRCTECGAPMTVGRESVRYTASGLPGVTLTDIEVRRCRSCGGFEEVIPRLDELHGVIALSVIGRRSRLAPSEIRFLRKYLGWSGVEFAAHMGTAAETVSRWEQGASQMGVVADRLLRLMVATRGLIDDHRLDAMKEVAQEQPSPLRLRVRPRRGTWRVAGVTPISPGCGASDPPARRRPTGPPPARPSPTG